MQTVLYFVLQWIRSFGYIVFCHVGFVGLECSDGKVVVLVGICALIKFISIEFAYAGN